MVSSSVRRLDYVSRLGTCATATTTVETTPTNATVRTVKPLFELHTYLLFASTSTLTTPIKGYSIIPIPRPAFSIFYLHTTFGDSRFSRSGDMIAGVDIENVSRNPDHAPYRVIYHRKARTSYGLPMCKI